MDIKKDHYEISASQYQVFLDNFLSEMKEYGDYRTNFSLLMHSAPDGEITQYNRCNEPCFGGMRRYGASSTLPNTHKPGDLLHPFPSGKPVAVMVYVPSLPYCLPAFGPRSPWISGFGSMDNIIFHMDHKVLTLIDTRIDPSVFVNMLRSIRGIGKGNKLSANESDPYYTHLWVSSYQNYSFADFELFCKQSPINASGGTWYDGFDYNRAWNESLFVTLKDKPNFDSPPTPKIMETPKTQPHYLTPQKRIELEQQLRG